MLEKAKMEGAEKGLKDLQTEAEKKINVEERREGRLRWSRSKRRSLRPNWKPWRPN